MRGNVDLRLASKHPQALCSLGEVVVREDDGLSAVGGWVMNKRLIREIALLKQAENGKSSGYFNSLVELLDEYESRPLPDVLPPKPAWREFQWPASEMVDFRSSPHQIKWSN